MRRVSRAIVRPAAVSAALGTALAVTLGAGRSSGQNPPAADPGRIVLFPDSPTTFLGQTPDPETLFVYHPCPAGFVRAGTPVPLNENPPIQYTDVNQWPLPTPSQMISDCNGPQWATTDPADCSIVSGFFFPNDSGINQWCAVEASLAAGSSPIKTYYKKVHGQAEVFGKRDDIIFDPGVQGVKQGCWAYSDFGKNTCQVDSWVTPGASTDLRCKVHVGASSLSDYSCNVIIKYTPVPGAAPPPPPPGPPHVPPPAGTIDVIKARIGCLSIQTDGNLTNLVAQSCNGKRACSYKAPTESEYKQAGVQAKTRTACTQGMEIDYNCGNGRSGTASIPGDAWSHPPAQLECEAPPSQPPPSAGVFHAVVHPVPPTPPPTPPPGSPDVISVTKARIGCLPIQPEGNLTGLVAQVCNGKVTCSYRAPNENQYKRAGVQAHTRSGCTQGMDIEYQCTDGRSKSASVPGDAWNHPAADLSCTR
jgi:hypothetical protein